MIIKYNDCITFQRCGTREEHSGEIKFESLDALYNSRTLDNIVLRDEWVYIKDISLNSTFSVVGDKEEFFELYGVEL